MCLPLFVVTVCSLAPYSGVGAAALVDHCAQPPFRENTKPLACQKDSQPAACKENDKLRYECVEGYVRKAGTSNRIVCERNMKECKGACQLKWTEPTLQCIEDPRKTSRTKACSQSQTTTTPTVPRSENTERDSPESRAPSPESRAPSPSSRPLVQTWGPTTTSRADPPLSSHTTTEGFRARPVVPEGQISVGTTVFTGVGSVVFIITVAIMFILYQKRRLRFSRGEVTATEDEQLQMHHVPPSPPSPCLLRHASHGSLDTCGADDSSRR